MLRPMSAALIFLSYAFYFAAPTTLAEESERRDSLVRKIGIIGLDTSHAPAFATVFNDENATGHYATLQVTHAFPGGSNDIESSRARLPQYVKEFEGMGIEIVDSVESLVENVDFVILHSLDGRKHLEQVVPVFKAGKPVFIDKPLGGSLAQAIAIQAIGEKYNAKWFTSSSLRFGSQTIKFRENEQLSRGVRGAIAWSPCSTDPTHPDLYWYGVHGVESLYTAMGKGCTQVTRVSTEGTDIAIGVWEDGRVGEFRGLRDGANDYGLVVFGEKTIEMGGKFETYRPLIDRVAAFFQGEYSGVDTAESIEMFAFMEAADESKRQGGAPVQLKDVMEKANTEALELVSEYK